MKKRLDPRALVLPMPVLVIATYNGDGTPNAMVATQAGAAGDDLLAVELSDRLTTENLAQRGALTVSFATEVLATASDYLGLVSGRDVPDKVARAGLHAETSTVVDAPVLVEYPLTLECEVVSLTPELGAHRLLARVVGVLADGDALDAEERVDAARVAPVVYDQAARCYRAVGQPVAAAFSAGEALR